MEELENMLHHVKVTLPLFTSLYPEIDPQILKSCIVYQRLYGKAFKQQILVPEILNLYDQEIGKIGPGNGCMTSVCEKLFGNNNHCHQHSCFHDAYGRFYEKFKKGRGYCYAIPEKYTTNFMKKSALLGHITGFYWSIKHSSDVF